MSVGQIHRIDGVPVRTERDPDDGQLFGVCVMCDRAWSLHTDGDKRACAEAAEYE